jgi:hypothetical protein
MFLHPLESVGHVVHSGVVPSAKHLRTIFKLWWDRYGFDKNGIGTRYAELEFLHPVGSMGQVVHSGASGA